MSLQSSNERMRLSEEKARNWLNSIDPENIDDLESVLDSIAESSIIDSSDSESGEEHALGTTNAKLKTSHPSDDDDEQYNDISKLSNYNNLSNWDSIKDQVLSRLPQPSFSNINITQASNVVLGNIIKIRGDLIINVKPNEEEGNNDRGSKDNDEVSEEDNEDLKARLVREAQQPTKETQNAKPKKTVYRPACLIVPRTSWLAMDPLDDYNYIQEPIDLVIISHTATTSSTQQSKNIGIIRDIQGSDEFPQVSIFHEIIVTSKKRKSRAGRLYFTLHHCAASNAHGVRKYNIQVYDAQKTEKRITKIPDAMNHYTFHIETRGWDDIGYNFLIGCDGIVYEGRGWGVEGAHTFSYNNKSIGITFIGCFMRKLPTTQALRACKKLLQRGVDEGHLSKNFKLLGHRQCTSTESPGSKLFEEIKTWENFYDKNDFDEEVNESGGE